MSQTKKMIAMLEYAKVILPKVSFSKELFRKELNKCIGWVEEDQRDELYAWCYENFKEIYPELFHPFFLRSGLKIRIKSGNNSRFFCNHYTCIST
jgi:hypothetical protein